MDQKMVVLEGKVFTIELQSMLGSTGYGWCLSQLPKGIIFEGADRSPVAKGIAPVMQNFYFGVSSAEETEAEITFVMACTFEPAKVTGEHKVSLTIIPSDSEKFVDYSENANALYAYAFNQADGCGAMNCIQPYGVWQIEERAQVQKPYGFPGPGFTCMDYGYPYGVQDVGMVYNYNYGAQNSGMAYGYPCGMQDAIMKYGYPCGMQDAMMKYGYFCGTNDALCKNEPFIRKNRNEPFITKYGFACR